ncbi:MAG: serine/threonine-protein kinase, partial [Pirellulaceae bacterium]
RIGPYRRERRRGLGAFGAVWLAPRRGALAATPVARKLPHYHPRLLAAVQSEAQTWVRASGHPHVVPILDADIYDGRVIIASEYIADGSLQDLLMRQQGSLLPLPESTDLVTGILIGLEHLHGRGIVHRDLKPANVLLQSGFPRLTDFGLSRLTTVDSSQQVGGTPAYMAPEAFNGERTTVTDLWSVGVILYQLLTGQLPFPQSRYLDLIRAISDPDPVNIPDFVPASLREVLRRSLAKQPEQRFQSAAEMRSHLSASRHEWEAVTGVPGTAGDGYRTIAVTGSMHCDSRQLRQNLAELLRPYYGRRTNWYVGTWGAVDEAAAEQLALDRQNLLLVGHRHDDISPHMRALIAQYELPFVDAAGLEIHHGSPSVPDEVPELRAVDSEAAAMNRRDHYFLARADLVVLVWDGFSRGTGAFLACLTQARKKHLLAFV